MGVIKKGGITFAGVSSLQELQDVTIDTLTLSNGQILKYNALNDKWENKDGSIQLSELTDVNIDSSTLADGNSLIYNETTGKWVNGEGGGNSSIIVIPGTLNAGETSITFMDARILDDSIISCATPAGINPVAMTSTTGSVTFYFASQAADMVVKVVIF